MTDVIEVYRHTAPMLGGIGRLVSVECVIDGQRRTLWADEWRRLVRRPDVRMSLSEKEGEWP